MRLRLAGLISVARPIAGALLILSSLQIGAQAADQFYLQQNAALQRAGSNEMISTTVPNSQLKWRPARGGSQMNASANTPAALGQVVPTQSGQVQNSNQWSQSVTTSNVVRTSATQVSGENGPSITPAQMIEPTPAPPQHRMARLQPTPGNAFEFPMQTPGTNAQPMAPSLAPPPMAEPMNQAAPFETPMQRTPPSELPGPSGQSIMQQSPEGSDLGTDVMNQDCEIGKRDLRPRLDSALSYKILNLAPSAKGDLPFECKTTGNNFNERNWGCLTYTWKASALCHKPLYFENWNMERYGHSFGPILDPFVGSAHFFGTLPLLPYKMGVDPICECQYPLGYYRPGNCAPYMCEPFPISARGAIAEAGAVAGAIYLIP